MLDKEKVIKSVKNRDQTSQAIDTRDFARLVDYFRVSDWHYFGAKLENDAEAPSVKEWTEANIKADLATDLAFAFQKALDCRGISASCMYAVVKMWLWVLEDELQHFDKYAHYGLPLLKEVAVKYALPNPIGDDSGAERKYTEFGE